MAGSASEVPPQATPGPWPRLLAWIRRASRDQVWVGVALRVLTVLVSAAAVALAVHGVTPGWDRGLGLVALLGFVLAVLPGLEWGSALGLVALFVAVVAQLLRSDLSMTRAVAIGLLLLVWALLAELAESVTDAPRQQPVRAGLSAFCRQAWPLLAAGAAGALVVGVAAGVAPTVGGLAATVLTVASPVLLVVAAVLGWQWRGWHGRERRRPAADPARASAVGGTGDGTDGMTGTTGTADGATGGASGGPARR